MSRSDASWLWMDKLSVPGMLRSPQMTSFSAVRTVCTDSRHQCCVLTWVIRPWDTHMHTVCKATQATTCPLYISWYQKHWRYWFRTPSSFLTALHCCSRRHHQHHTRWLYIVITTTVNDGSLRVKNPIVQPTEQLVVPPTHQFVKNTVSLSMSRWS